MRLLLTLLPALVVGVLFWIALEPENAAGPDPVAPGPSGHAPWIPATEGTAPRAVAVAATSTTSTAREFLRGYWGSDWETVSARLLAEGHDLSIPFEAPAWAEVERSIHDSFQLDEDARSGLIESLADWPNALTTEWIRDEFAIELDALQLAELEALALPFNIDLQLHGEDYANLLDQAMQQAWVDGRYTAAPFSNPPIPEDPSQVFFSATTLHRGWAATLYLHRLDHPHLLAMRDDMRNLRRQRDQAVHHWIAAL